MIEKQSFLCILGLMTAMCGARMRWQKNTEFEVTVTVTVKAKGNLNCQQTIWDVS